MNKHIVIYMGTGIWKDNKGELWGKSSTNSSILESRTFESDKDKGAFLDDRKDIAFMVEYGQIKMESVSQEIVPPVDVKPVVPPVDVKPSVTISPSK